MDQAGVCFDHLRADRASTLLSAPRSPGVAASPSGPCPSLSGVMHSRPSLEILQELKFNIMRTSITMDFLTLERYKRGCREVRAVVLQHADALPPAEAPTSVTWPRGMRFSAATPSSGAARSWLCRSAARRHPHACQRGMPHLPARSSKRSTTFKAAPSTPQPPICPASREPLSFSDRAGCPHCPAGAPRQRAHAPLPRSRARCGLLSSPMSSFPQRSARRGARLLGGAAGRRTAYRKWPAPAAAWNIRGVSMLASRRHVPSRGSIDSTEHMSGSLCRIDARLRLTYTAPAEPTLRAARARARRARSPCRPAHSPSYRSTVSRAQPPKAYTRPDDGEAATACQVRAWRGAAASARPETPAPPRALGHRVPARDADLGARGGARGGGAAGRASSMSGPGSHRAPPRSRRSVLLCTPAVCEHPPTAQICRWNAPAHLSAPPRAPDARRAVAADRAERPGADLAVGHRGAEALPLHGHLWRLLPRGVPGRPRFAPRVHKHAVVPAQRENPAAETRRPVSRPSLLAPGRRGRAGTGPPVSSDAGEPDPRHAHGRLLPPAVLARGRDAEALHAPEVGVPPPFDPAVVCLSRRACFTAPAAPGTGGLNGGPAPRPPTELSAFGRSGAQPRTPGRPGTPRTHGVRPRIDHCARSVQPGGLACPPNAYTRPPSATHACAERGVPSCGAPAWSARLREHSAAPRTRT